MLVMNRSLKFTILYLPTRSVRFEGKQSLELTPKELNSPEFLKRSNEFLIFNAPAAQEEPQAVTQETEEQEEVKPKRRTKKETSDIKIEAETDSEPIVI